MPHIDTVIKEHFIPTDYELERFVESFYPDKKDVDALKASIRKMNEDAGTSARIVKLKKVSRVVLIGEKKFKSLKSVAPKLDYADPTKLEYKISGDKISVWDDENKFTISPDDITGTIVIVVSGYTDKVVRYLLDSIADMGITVINDPYAVNISNNKYLIALHLLRYGIPQPKFTLITSADIDKEDTKRADAKLATLYPKITDDTPFVCKILGGHGGTGVFKCTKFNIMSILQCIFAIKPDTPILVQEFKEIKDGDIRVHVLTINGHQEIVSASMRKKDGPDFRTNLSLGNGIDTDIKLTPAQKKLALETAKASHLIWCGVDIMPTKDGKDVVVEYNGAPGPPSEIDSDDIEKVNAEFYSSLIKKINSLCSE